LIQYYINTNNIVMRDAVVSTYIDFLDGDIRTLFDGNGLIGKDVMNHSEFYSRVKSLYDEVKVMTPTDISTSYGKNICKLSNVMKWFPRPGNKQFSNQLPLLYNKMYNITNFENDKSKNFYEMLTRYLLTLGNTLLNVVELRFSQQQYNYIYPEKTPAKAFATKRLAFLNEICDNKMLNKRKARYADTMRSTNPDRIDLRNRTLEMAAGNKLKVLVESNNFADMLRKYNIYDNFHSSGHISEAEQIVIESLWRKHIEDITIRVMKDYNTNMDKWRENGSNEETEPMHPLDCIATIDTSSSMASANVHYEAVINGLTVSEISRMAPGIFITFHDTPTLVDVSRINGFINKFIRASKAPWGGSTNIDKANELLLQIVVEVKKRNPLFKSLFILFLRIWDLIALAVKQVNGTPL